ncbi:MAG: hypothetical protein LQ350_006453 [Teloschistes chrysophthalmus]|nr:MAG: hypothetical protein LQ350_006453 [Niorma chrysophthalma]
MPTSTLRPYDERSYSRTLNCIRELISLYNHHCTTAENPCEQCLAGWLRTIASQISKLMEYAPSKDAATEYAHYSQLDRMSKQLLRIDEKSVCQEIWTLINRKLDYLESTPLAKPLPRAAYGQGAWIEDDLHGWRASDVDDFFDGDDFNSMESEDEETPIQITFQPRRGRQPVTLMSEGRVNETNMAVLRDAINAPSATDENLPGATSSAPESSPETQQPRELSSAQPSVRLEDLITNYNLIDPRSSAANNPPARTFSSLHNQSTLPRAPSPPFPPPPRLRSAIADFGIVERAPPPISQADDEPTELEGEDQGASLSGDLHWTDGTEHAYMTVEEQWNAAGRPATVIAPLAGPGRAGWVSGSLQSGTP